MRLAIDEARQGIAAGQSPFGCAVARPRDSRFPLATAHNTVVASVDITAHAEINALRQACRAAGDIFLSGAVVATTCEPCPMCLAALHWARVETVYYGATIADADAAGFNELKIPAQELIRRGGGTLQLVPGVLADECRQLFALWQASPDRRAY